MAMPGLSDTVTTPTQGTTIHIITTIIEKTVINDFWYYCCHPAWVVGNFCCLRSRRAEL